jgi:hypothetical protein
MRQIAVALIVAVLMAPAPSREYFSRWCYIQVVNVFIKQQ